MRACRCTLAVDAIVALVSRGARAGVPGQRVLAGAVRAITVVDAQFAFVPVHLRRKRQIECARRPQEADVSGYKTQFGGGAE